MRKFTKKQYLAAGAAAVIIAGGAGAAFAYWTSTGGGSGSASVGAGTNDLVATGNAATALVPGGTSSIAFNVHNNNTQSSEHFGSVSYQIATGVPNCSATDFSITGLPSNQTVAPGGDATATATIAMANTDQDQ